MTDSNTLADYNIKDFGKLTRYVPAKRENEFVTAFESRAFYSDRICIECGNDHSYRGNFKDAMTSIDTLPALFKDSNRSNCKLQEFVN
jgi:hypothetical protein